VKLFSKYSNLCDHGTWTSQTDRRTDDYAASRGKKSKAESFQIGPGWNLAGLFLKL